MKFGAFVEYLESQHGGSFDRIASGHYARVMTQQQYESQQQQQQQQHCLQEQEQQQPTSSADIQLTDLQQQLADRLASHNQASSSSSNGSGSNSSSMQQNNAKHLCLTPDAVKDQTYFLANLSTAQLSRCMFPLGGFTKPQVSLQPSCHVSKPIKLYSHATVVHFVC